MKSYIVFDDSNQCALEKFSCGADYMQSKVCGFSSPYETKAEGPDGPEVMVYGPSAAVQVPSPAKYFSV